MKVARLVSGAYLRVSRVGRWCNYISRYGGVFGFALYERKFRNYSTADVQTFLRALARSPVVTWQRTWLLFNVDDEFLTADDEFLTARYPPVILHLLRR